MGNAWGISHQPFYLPFHNVSYILEEVFWKIIFLRTLKIITMGPTTQGPTNIL